MKVIYIIFILCCIISCKEKSQEKINFESKNTKNEFNDLKANIGLPESYTDTLSLLSYDFGDYINKDKKFLKIDYKTKLDSLYEIMDEELNIIGFEDHFTEDARESLEELKESCVIDQKAAYSMWSSSYGTNYREYRNDENAFKRIEQMIYKRRYEELLIYNFHLRSNLTRWIEGPSTISYRKRLKDVMPKKVMDSMYPKRSKKLNEK